MEMKEMIRFGILVFVVFAVFVTGNPAVGAYVNITDIGIKDDIPRVGFLEYQNTGLENQNGVLLITVDGVDVWEGKVRTYTYHVGDEIYSPVRYKHFSLIETNGTHQIEAVLKTDKRSIVFAWTKKEFRNLKRSCEVGIPAPSPIVSEKNILIMKFIGKDGVGAPRLKDIGLDLCEPEANFDKISGYVVDLYNKAGLVHGDLSEFNILYMDGPILIDMGQAVTLDHPMAEEFLKRDIKNLIRFFKKLGVKCDEEEVMERVKAKNSASERVPLYENDS